MTGAVPILSPRRARRYAARRRSSAWATPGAGPGAGEATPTAPTPTPPVATSGDHGWVDAAIVVVLALFAAATVAAVRLRRRSLPLA